MRNKLLWAGLVLMLVLGMQVVSADDGAPKPGTPEDNECNPGGVLYREENQDGCATVWYWKAGWFLARYNRGLISRDNFPEEYASVLPPPTEFILKTICEAQELSGYQWYGCVSSDQTGFEKIDDVFVRYLLFVNDPANCPSSQNGLGFFGPTDTQSYMFEFYSYEADDLASIGGLLPVTCIYAALI